MKKIVLQSILFLGIAFAGQAFAAAKPPVPLTAVVVPAHYTPVQIGLDMAERYPAVLISYQKAATGETSLHAWSGKRWIPVSTDDFAEASFFKMTPSRVLVVGEDNTAMEMISLAEGWSPEVFNLASENSADMVNTLGQLFEFNSGEWKWFANRYQMDIQDLNQDRRSSSWYDQPYVDERRAAVSGVVIDSYQPEESTYINEASMPIEVEEVEEVYTPETPAAVLPSAQLSTPVEPQIEAPSVRTSAPALPAFKGWSESATTEDTLSK